MSDIKPHDPDVDKNLLTTNGHGDVWAPCPRSGDAVDDLLHLAGLALALGRVDRVTYHPDGTTRESDTDHTVMLALVAPAMAARLRPDLRPELVCAFATVHDLVEVKTGDTNTIGITAEGRAAKAEREAAALAELREELVAFPWIVDTLDRYEAQVEPEARWTRYLDKLLPKLTHALNHGATLRAMGKSIAEIRTDGARQREELRAEYPEFPEADALLWQAMEVAEAACTRGDEPWRDLTDRAHRLRAAIPALRFASHPDRMTGPYAMALAGLADDIEAGRVVRVAIEITVHPPVKPPPTPAPQPAPTHGRGDVWQEVIDTEHFRLDSDPRLIERWEARRRVGIERYGVPLGRGDGRDPYRDLLEELDDAIAYAARVCWSDIADELRGVLIRALDRVAGGAR